MAKCNHLTPLLIFVCDVQECVRNWLQSRLDALHSADADPALSLTRQFINVLHETTVILTPISSISQYFARLGLDYYKMASIACDSKVGVLQQLTVIDTSVVLIIVHQ